MPYKNKKDRVTHRKEKVDFIRNYKSERGCSICGETEPICLDFHHNIGLKENSIARMCNNGCSIEKIMEEISKCIILCKNCHAKTHK